VSAQYRHNFFFFWEKEIYQVKYKLQTMKLAITTTPYIVVLLFYKTT